MLMMACAWGFQGERTNPGVVPRAVRDVFDIIEKTPGREFLLRLSMMEIYNEVGQEALLVPCHCYSAGPRLANMRQSMRTEQTG